MLAVALAVLLRWLLEPFLAHRLPFITLYAAVAVAVWFGGWRPALLATLVGYVTTDLLFIETEPNSPLSLKGAGGIVGMAVFFASALIVIGFGNGMRSAGRRAQANAREALAKQKLLEREVAERRQAQEVLAQSDRRKDEFLAMLAHELRNPLAPMRHVREITRLAQGDPKLIEQANDIIDRQVEQMVRLVDDLLDLSRVTSGKMELRKSTVELRAVIENALETCRPAIEAAGHDLTVVLPPEPIHLDADPTRLAQVFWNLLNNACKYTEKGGHIWLTGERQGDEVVVRVEDTGIGIAADMLPRVFEMFAQAERARERSQGGLGIGLTLTRRLVELHGGTIEARSDGPGRGSEFLLRLPAAPEQSREARAARGEGGDVAPAKRRILVADDNKDVADSLGMLLTIRGNDVHVVYGGSAAVGAAATLRPDVVLLDIGMPDMSGYEAARRIREQPGGERAVLIAVTGWGEAADRGGSPAGFDFHLMKPVDTDRLAKLLASRGQA